MSFGDTYRIVTPADDRGRDVEQIHGFAFIRGVAIGDEAASAARVPRRFLRVVEEVATGGYRGTYAAFDQPTIVPGGARVANLGLTMVAVHPGHRRRGMLRHMIADHFRAAQEHGAIMSTLFAAEPGIYGRFGYAMAGEISEVVVGRGVELAPVAGSDALQVEVETLVPERHGPVLAEVASKMTRPGNALMGDEVLRWFTLDKAHAHGDREPRRVVLVRDGADAVAAATFTREAKLDGGVPGSVVRVGFHGALTPAAERRSWSVLTDLDLTATIEADLVTPDHPLLRLIGAHRGVVKHVMDGIWARLIDVKACMEARTYGADVALTLALTDDLLSVNGGLWRLEATAGCRGTFERVAGVEPDIALTIQQLSGAYLGGVTLSSLHAAGQIDQSRGFAALELSRALRGDMDPAPNFHF
ncbi:MAG: GNAT family N-acetyltransferase [Arachnia sp.]